MVETAPEALYNRGMQKIERTQRFAEEIRSWFTRWKRTLPWRDLAIQDDTQRAYMVLVSEVMLQQTQVSRVKIVFKNFLEIFPTLPALASATNKEVILAWRGMGYNSRALRLRDAAKTIMTDFGGVFPQDFDTLLSIKGIGHYTAGAIRNFAFNLPTPCVDTNIHRILHRVFDGPEPETVNAAVQKQVMKLADETLKVALDLPHPNPLPLGEGARVRGNAWSPRDWHAALMDFGSLVCKKSSPLCDVCPLSRDGTCKSAFRIKNVNKRKASAKSKTQNQEPGRMMGAKYIPNRIFRGRIVEALRDSDRGLSLEQIGNQICTDWSAQHRKWLKSVIRKLETDGLVRETAKRFQLAD